MTIFPTKWRANEQQGGGWAPTSYCYHDVGAGAGGAGGAGGQNPPTTLGDAFRIARARRVAEVWELIKGENFSIAL